MLVVMGKGPVPASRAALKYTSLEVKDIDFWEITEAFAIVTLWAIKELGGRFRKGQREERHLKQFRVEDHIC